MRARGAGRKGLGKVMLSLLIAASVCTTDIPEHVVNMAELEPVIDAYKTLWHVEPKIEHEACGEVNAYYSPLYDTITLCDEMLVEPTPVVRFVLAHELAHAAMTKAGLPPSEASADELAALIELRLKRDDVVATAAWFLANGIKDSPANGLHPRNLDRAKMLVCLDDGFDDHPANEGCYFYEHRAVAMWQTFMEATLGKSTNAK